MNEAQRHIGDNKLAAVLGMGLLVLVLTGCASRAPGPGGDPGPLVISKRNFVRFAGGEDSTGIAVHGMPRQFRQEVLEPRDRITFAIYEKLPVSQEPRLEKKRITDEGSVFLLPVGEVNIAGLTIPEAEDRIEEMMAKYIVSPLCEITIDKRGYEPRCYVFGEVVSPGAFALKPGDRLLDLIANAGGCEADAYKRSVKVMRVESTTVTMYDVDLDDILSGGMIEQNLFLRDQDVVFVPRRFYTNFAEVFSVLSTLLPWYYFVRNFGVDGGG
jgi:protein involved in polysaccharide export with SLBB domain